MDVAGPGHLDEIPCPGTGVRGFLDFACHEVFLGSEPGSEVFEFLGARGGDGVAFAYDPGAVGEVAPFEFLVLFRVGAVERGFDGAGEHGEHFGCVAAGAEADEEVGGLIGVAAAVADGFVAGWVRYEGDAVEDREEGEADEEGEEDEGGGYSHCSWGLSHTHTHSLFLCLS